MGAIKHQKFTQSMRTKKTSRNGGACYQKWAQVAATRPPAQLYTLEKAPASEKCHGRWILSLDPDISRGQVRRKISAPGISGLEGTSGLRYFLWLGDFCWCFFVEASWTTHVADLLIVTCSLLSLFEFQKRLTDLKCSKSFQDPPTKTWQDDLSGFGHAFFGWRLLCPILDPKSTSLATGLPTPLQTQDISVASTLTLDRNVLKKSQK